MPVYSVTGPDGREFELEGDSPPSEAELEEVWEAVGGGAAPARLSPLKPEGPAPAFSTEVPGLPQGPVPAYQPQAPLPQRHGLVAAGVQKAGFPGAAEKVEQVDQYLPGKAAAVGKAVGGVLEKGGPALGLGLAALDPLAGIGAAMGGLSEAGRAAQTPGEMLTAQGAGALGGARGALEESLPAFLSAENLVLMAVSHGTGMAAKAAQTAKSLVPGVAEAIAAAARMGEIGEVAKYAKQLEKLDRTLGRGAMLAQIGRLTEASFALGLGTKGGTEVWDAAKRGDWMGVAQGALNLTMAAGVGAQAVGTRIPARGPRTDTAPFMREAQHEALARPLRDEYSLETLTEKRVQDAWGRAGGVDELRPGEPVPGLTPEAGAEHAWAARAVTLGRGRQPGAPVPEAPATGTAETLQIAQEAETARRVLALVERGQLVLPPEGIAALQADAARGIQPPAAPPVGTPGEVIPGGPVSAGVVARPGEPVPTGIPTVEGPPVPMGTPVPVRARLSTTPEVLSKVPRERVFQEVEVLQRDINRLRAQERPSVVDSEALRTKEAELARVEAFLRGEALPPLEEPGGLGPRGPQPLSVRTQLVEPGLGHRIAPGPQEPAIALGAPLPPSEATPASPRAVEASPGRGMGIGEAPPGVSPEPPPTGMGESPPTPLDVAATEAAARLQASAGLRGKGPTEAHAGFSTQNLKDMTTVAAARLARVGKKPTRAEWETDLRKRYGDLPKAALDRAWNVAEGAAALGPVAGPRVAAQFVDEMAGPPKTKRVVQAFGVEGEVARRINNSVAEVIRRTERAAPDHEINAKQVRIMQENLSKLVEEGHMGQVTQAAFAKEGTAPREQTAKLRISEDDIGTVIVGLERMGKHVEAVVADLEASGIPLEAGGKRTSAAFKGDPDLKQALDSMLGNLLEPGSEFGRIAKSLGVIKSTWARIGHRQQEAARAASSLQSALERVPGAMERLRTAGIQLEGIRSVYMRKPYLTELGAAIKDGLQKGRVPETSDVLALIRMWRLQFSNFSFLKDISSDTASLGRHAAWSAGHDAWWALRSGKLEAPALRGLVEAARYRFTEGAFRPVAGGIEEKLGSTAFGEPMRPGTAPPAGSAWMQRALHALNREGAAGEATMRGTAGNTRFQKALSIAMDEGSARGLYLKGGADTFTKRLVATSVVEMEGRLAGQAKGLAGADLEAFVSDYRKNMPEWVRDEAARMGADAGFNQKLLHWEKQWFRDNPIVQALWDPFAGWMLQHTRWLRDTAGFAIYKSLKDSPRTGVPKEAEVAGAVAQALSGWGGMYYVLTTVVPHVDPETGDYVDPATKNRLPLQGIEPLASAVALNYLALGDVASFTKMWRYSSLPLGSALSGGGIVGRPVDLLGSYVRDPSALPNQVSESFMNTVNRLFPERPALEVAKALTDPISRRGFGSFMPGYSKTLPAIISPATGKPKETHWDVPGISGVLERLGLKRDIPLTFGGQIPLATRIVDPVEKLLEAFDVPSSAAKRVPGIYRNMPDLPGNLSPRDLTRAQRDKWWEFYGQERQRLLGPMAKRLDEFMARAKRDPQYHRGIRQEIEDKDAAAARSAVQKLLRADKTLRPTAAKKEPPYTGPYADRPGTEIGTPVP